MRDGGVEAHGGGAQGIARAGLPRRVETAGYVPQLAGTYGAAYPPRGDAGAQQLPARDEASLHCDQVVDA